MWWDVCQARAPDTLSSSQQAGELTFSRYGGTNCGALELWSCPGVQLRPQYTVQSTVKYMDRHICSFIISHNKSQSVLVGDLPVGIAARSLLIVQFSPLRKFQVWPQSSIKFW